MPKRNASGSYTNFVGKTYVRGIMDGEAIRSRKRMMIEVHLR